MSGPAQPHLLPVLSEVIKARAHKYLRRYRGKDGKYKYVYPKKAGKAASRHEGAMSDRSGFLGDPSIYTKGASFAGAPGEGHYVIESTDGSNVTFYLDEDKSGKRGSSKTMSRSKFRAMLTQKHRKRFEQASEEGYQRRKELVFRSQEGTPERSRAVKELARWVSLNEVYLSEDTHVEFQDIRDDFDPERVKASREEQRREEEEARAKEEREEAEREQAKRKPHLEALGLPADATNREIKKQYRKLSLQHHPDRNPGDPTAVEKMKRINNAFDALGGQVMKALDWAIHEVIKARAHKYLRRYRGKDGKYKYVYPKKAGKAASRHEGAMSDHKSYLGDKKIYQPGTSFAAGAGKGHYVIESVKGNSITFHLDEDETGAKGEARTMSYKDFRNMLRSEHRESFKRAAREGLQRRKDVLVKTMEGTPARKRAENEVRRWESANSDYLPRGAARKRAFGALGKFVKDGGERAEAMRTLLGVESFTQASTEDVQALAVKLESASPADFQRMMHGGSGKEDKPEGPKTSSLVLTDLQGRILKKMLREASLSLTDDMDKFQDRKKWREAVSREFEAHPDVVSIPVDTYAEAVSLGRSKLTGHVRRMFEKLPQSSLERIRRAEPIHANSSSEEVKKALDSEVVKAVPDIDLTPTEQMAANARRGLEMRKNASDSNKGGLTTEEAGKQGIGSGVARAASIANRDKLSPETVRRMKAFFDRHSAYKHKHESEPEGKAKQSWLLWGGDAGYTWAKSKVEQMNRAEVKKGLMSRVKGAVSRLFGKKKGQGRWVTTKKEPRRKLFIDGDGNPTKGNPVVLAAAQGKNPRKEAERLKAESSSMGGSAGKSKVEGKAEGSSKTQSSTDNSKGKGESVQQTPTSRSEGLHRILRENPVAKRFIDAKTAEESHSIKMDYETAKLLDSYSSDATEIRKELLKQPHGWIALYKAERVFQTSGKDKQANDIQSLKFVQEHVESIQEAWDKTGCMLFDRLGEDFNPDAFRGLMEGIDVYNQVIDVRESVGPFGIKLAVGSHKERALHGGYLLNDRAILVAQARGDLGKRGEDTLIHEIAHAMDHAKEMIKASDEGADTKKIGYFSQKNADRVKAVTDGFFKSDAGTLPFTREKVDKQAMQSPTSSSEHTYENYLDLPEERFARIAQQYIDDKSVTVRGIGPTLMQWLVGTSLSEKTGFWSKRHMRKHEKEIQSLLSEVGFKFREEVKKGLVEVKKALVEVIKAKLSDGKGRWVTTKNDRKIFINSDGVPTKGNPHIIARMKGEDQSHRSATLDATQRGMEAATKKLDGLGKLPKSYGEAAQKIDALEKIVKRAQDAHSHAKKTGLMTPSGSDTAKHKETRKKIESGLSAIKSKIEEYRKASPHSDHIVRLMKLSRSMDVASEVKKALLDLVLAQLRGTV